MSLRRKGLIAAVASAFGLALATASAPAADLQGTVTSVDPGAHKVTIAPMDGGAPVVVSVSDTTEWISGKGKVIKNASLTRIKPGQEMALVHVDAEVSKIVLKDDPNKVPSAKNTKKKAEKANKKKKAKKAA